MQWRWCAVLALVLAASVADKASAWTLAWDAYMPTVGAPPLQGFRLEKSIDAQATWTTVTASLGPTATSTTDPTAGRGVLTDYRLIALAASGVESVPGNVVSHRVLHVRRHRGNGFR